MMLCIMFGLSEKKKGWRKWSSVCQLVLANLPIMSAAFRFSLNLDGGKLCAAKYLTLGPNSQSMCFSLGETREGGD
jgi:hypothetical protein